MKARPTSSLLETNGFEAKGSSPFNPDPFSKMRFRRFFRVEVKIITRVDKVVGYVLFFILTVQNHI
jgi:hypothetical protein